MICMISFFHAISEINNCQIFNEVHIPPSWALAATPSYQFVFTQVKSPFFPLSDEKINSIG